jgi:ADP-ribosyl-[dinitrogen reductase] hydrolase
MKRMVTWADKFAGVLLGGAVGDAVGLPREGLAPGRAARMFGGRPLEHRLVLRRGMISDDTEHACMTAQALLASGGDPGVFGRSLAWRLRGWLLGVPAGIGWATLRAIVKLWAGFGPEHSGVRSAGNGPAMRAPVVGVWAAAKGLSAEEMAGLIRASTRLTHTDERAEEGTMVMALAAAHGAMCGGVGVDAKEVMGELQKRVRGTELGAKLQQVTQGLKRGASAEEMAKEWGLARGVSGYMNHTVPMALFCWLRQPGDFRAAVEEVIALGGDADTTAAIVGGLAGATLGVRGIPETWIDGLWEWPRSVGWMRALAARLADAKAGMRGAPLPLWWPGFFLRNPMFAAIVLAHGLRRTLPPYL